MNYKIAIDGTAGSGKSTICKLIAKDFDFIFVSTGGFYRAFAYILNKAKKIDASEEEIINELDKYSVEVKGDVFYIDNNEVTSLLKTEDISLIASTIASRGYIRNYVNKRLVELIKTYPKVLMDGRGIVEEIMPDADLKLFFYSSLFVRTKRRVKELKQLNKKGNFISVYFDLMKRDWKDKHRELAPSKLSSGTIKINTSKKNIDEVYLEVKKYIKV